MDGQLKDMHSVKMCPRCRGTAVLVTPTKKLVDKKLVVYHCQACKHTFDHMGNTFVKNTEELKDVFRGATGAQKVLDVVFKSSKIPPAVKSLFQSQMLEYGVQMWFDGLKQGLLMGAQQNESAGKRGGS